MSKPELTKVCSVCKREIVKVRVSEGGRKWRWKSEYGFYCAKGPDYWHDPALEEKASHG